MGRARRCIVTGRVYEITFRTVEGLPFVVTEYMKLLLSSAMARAQRDGKVIICSFIWMGNHAHIIIVVKDQQQCANFHKEIKKQLTESLKQLLGKKYLRLWKDNGTSVFPIGDLKGAIERIAYLYANPAASNLVDCIDHYPGLSSWDDFKNSCGINAKVSKDVPWVRTPYIKKLPNYSVSEAQDRRIVMYLNNMAKANHILEICPNAWMKFFQLRDEDVQGVNSSIIDNVRAKEKIARQVRMIQGLKTMGPSRLRRESITKEYYPDDDTIKIYVYAADREIRNNMLEEYKIFCCECENAYQKWKLRDYTAAWPPGAFIPPMALHYNDWEPDKQDQILIH